MNMSPGEEADACSTEVMLEAKYRPRNPSETILYKAVEKHLAAFRAKMDEREQNIPAYVLREFNDFLGCGDPLYGFVRLKCCECDHEKILPLSCKRRGFCPSCCGRRMNETEAHLIDDVFPEVNARQWILSIPAPLRIYGSRNRKLINLLLRIFYESIHFLIRKKLRAKGIRNTFPGGAVFIQRIGGALNLNIHFHAIFLDGAYEKDNQGNLTFHNIAQELTSEDIVWATERIARRSVKAIDKLGLLESHDEVQAAENDNGLLQCDSTSVKNLILLGERSGEKVRKLRLRTSDQTANLKGEMVASMHGFNLKADRLIKGHQRWKLARLVRYVTRPPVSNERLTLSEDGKTIFYTMKRPWSDGTYQIHFSGLELVEKLASAIPPPRGHLVRYTGVLAPNSAIRRKIVIRPKPKARDQEGKLNPTAKQRLQWAALAKRTFGVDLTLCEKCSGPVRRLTIILDPDIIQKILHCYKIKEFGCPTAGVGAKDSQAPPQEICHSAAAAS